MTESKDAITDLCERLHLLRLRYQVVFRELSPANPPYIPLATSLAKGLADQDPAAATLIQAVVDYTEREKVEFWRTPLGRLTFLAGGYDREHCSQTIAAAVLGVSRQWVSALVARRKLDAEHGEVFAAEVRDILKARIDTVVNQA